MTSRLETHVAAPQVVQLQPAPALRPYIECYWMLDAPHGFDQFTQRLPADSRIELIFSFAEGLQRTAADGSDVCEVGARRYLLGTRRQGYTFQPDGAFCCAAVRFSPGGMAAFSPFPSMELNDIYADADCLWSRAALEALQDRLAMRTPQAQARLLDHALLALLKPPPHFDRVRYALDRIVGTASTLEVAALADEINLSQKHMERLFSRYVGLSPRFTMRIARFQRVLADGLNAADELSLSQLALDAGYYDQAHFSREFKLFAGVSPARFFAESNPFVEDIRTP